MKQAMGLGAAVAALLASATASAQTSFGQKGDFGIAVERAFGLYSGHQRFSPNGPGPDRNVDTSAVEIGIGGGLPHVSAMTRIGVDGFIIDHLSLGGSVGFASYGDDLDGSVFLFAPRVGYFAGISRHVGFWGRGGFSYYSVDDDPIDRWQLMLTAEALFTFAPNDGFAFLVGPILDFGFAGNWEPADGAYRDRVFGLTFGIVGLL